jgi:hypothetical protein
LPDLTGYKSGAAKRIARLVKEHASRVRELGSLGSDLEQARYGVEEARSQDTEARALAARKGGEDPGREHEEKAKVRLEELQDQYRVMERVVQDVEADLSTTVTESRSELLEEARRKRDQAGERYTQAHAELRAAHDEQRHHAGVARWALSGSAHFSPPPPNVHVLSVPDVLPDDDPEPNDELITEISAETAAPILRGA